MNEGEDIRWKQRLENFRKALGRLLAAIELREVRPLSELENQGMIQAFEYTYELAWNTVRDYYLYQGDDRADLQGSRDVFRLAFERELVDNGKLWMDMVKSRQLTSHTYDEKTAAMVVEDIAARFGPALRQLEERLSREASQS